MCMHKLQYALIFWKLFLGLKPVNFFESTIFRVIFKILIISTQLTVAVFSKINITESSVRIKKYF